MTTTPNLGMPYIMPSQAQKHVTHNEAVRALDALVQMGLKSRSLAQPPEGPTPGSRFLVAAPATGEWAGHDGQIASWNDGAWSYFMPKAGWTAWIEDEQTAMIHDGEEWRPLLTAGAAGVSLPRLGINTQPDAANLFAAKAANVLLDNEGSDQRLKINKAGAANSASQLFQTGYSGRAEIGLTGDDDLHFKVSADGAAWREALIVDSATGAVSMPMTPARANLLINGDFAINQRSFAGGALAAGNFGYDRWKATTGGATITVSEGIATLDGEIEQIIEPGILCSGDLASSALTLSVDDPSHDLAVQLGGATGTIAAGSSRRYVTLTTGSGDSGPLSLRIRGASGTPVSFARARLEAGTRASPWSPRSRGEEELLCRRYFLGPVLVAASGYATAGGQTARAMTSIIPPVTMAAVPNVAFSSLFAYNTDGVIVVAGSSTAGSILLTQTSQAEGGMTWYGYATFDAEL